MIIKASAVKGLPVIAKETGKSVEKVDDIVYDPQANKVEALLVGKPGVFTDAKVILLTDAKGIGKDAVLIESEQHIKKASEAGEKISSLIKEKKQIPKSKIITEGGTSLGKISDLLFDSVSGKVEEYELSQGTVKDIQSGKQTIKVTDIVKIGEETSIVKEAVKQQIEEKSKEGGVKGKIKETITTVKEKGQELKENRTSQQESDKKKQENAVSNEIPSKADDKLATENIEVRETPEEKTENSSKISGVFKPAENPTGSSGNFDDLKKS